MDTNLSFFEKMIIAMWKVEKYPLLINQKLSDTVKTFLIVSLLQVITIAILIVSFGNQIIKTQVDAHLHDIPEFTIEDSKLSVTMQDTIIYNDPSNLIFLFVDSQINNLEVLEKYNNIIMNKPIALIITNDKFVITKKNHIYEYNYNKFEKWGITDKETLIDKYVNVVKKEIIPLIYIVLIILVTIILIISKFIGGYMLLPLVRLYARKKSIEFSKTQGYNLVMYSGIFATSLSMILTAVSIALPFWIIVKLALIYIFVNKGIQSYKQNKI